MVYRCPHCQGSFRSDVAGLVRCPLCRQQVCLESRIPGGCAWDRAERGGWSNAFFQTIRDSLADPLAFFESVAAGAGWVRPLAYALIISVAGFLMAVAYQAIFQALSMGIGIAARMEEALSPFAALSLPLAIGVMIILGVVGVPIFTTGVIFLQSAICHACLMVLGAARRDYWATFRTLCYSNGPQAFQVVPLLGSLVGPVWQLVLIIIGLKVVHQTSYGRSAMAIFLPAILCCGMILLVGITILGGIAGALLR